MECNGLPCSESVDAIRMAPEHLAAFTLPEEAWGFQADGEDVLVKLSSGLLERRLHEHVDFSLEEQRSLQKLRQEAQRTGKRFSPEVCREASRYLSATRNNHERALGLMEATDKWRKTYFKDGPLRSEDIAEDISHGFAYFGGRDKALRPALIFRASRVPDQWRRDFNVDRLLRVLIFLMEAMLQFLLIPGKVETSCLIIDLRDVAIKDIPVSLLREIHQLFTAYYPCRGFRFYMCNVPRMLMAMSHVAKSLLTERQKLKVKVLGDVSELLEDFAPHQLETDLGGSKPLARAFIPFPLAPGPFEPGSSPRLGAVENLHRFTWKEALELLESKQKAENEVASPSSEETRPARSASDRLTSHSRSPDSFELYPFREGDMVEVWSVSQHAWMPGVVQAFYAQSTVAEGFQVPAGALKVTFSRGCKWIPQELVASNVRSVASSPYSPTSPSISQQCRQISDQGRILLSASLAEDAMSPQPPTRRSRCGFSPDSDKISAGCLRDSWFCL
ncbi:unnamed protein product [Effrenium voratum]|nr:unnamed protein product [Effrenium voratum]